MAVRGRVLATVAVAIATLTVTAVFMRSPDEVEANTSLSSAQINSDAMAAFLAEVAAAEFEPLKGIWTLSLPRDHGAHPEARVETWSVTAHLVASTTETFDLALSLARYGLIPPEDGVEPLPWTVSALHAGQFLLFNGQDGTGNFEHRFSRASITAGHDAEAREVWLDNWSFVHGDGADGEVLRLRAAGLDASVDLLLVPGKPAISANEEAASTTRGFTIPRLAVTGTIRTPQNEFAVSGTASLDRLWGDLPASGGPIAYDRLTLQLSNGTDISIVHTRRVGRQGAGTYDAVLVDEEGRASYLGDNTLSVEVLEMRRMADDTIYPVSWRVTGEGFDLMAAASTEDARQEFIAPMWRGPVSVEGEMHGAEVQGSGMLLLTGYDQGKP